MAKTKKPASRTHGTARKGVAVRKAQKPKLAATKRVQPKTSARTAPDPASVVAAIQPGRGLQQEARQVLERSGWPKLQQEQLNAVCRELVARLNKTCPDLVVGRALKASEVAGEIAVKADDFRTILVTAAGAKTAPRVVWSDGANELLVEVARIAIKLDAGLVHVQIPAFCEETGVKIISVTFATGSEKNPAGLIFAAETRPMGPPEIVDIWGEALVALAWTSLLKAVSSLADVAGRDEDGAGLVPAGLAASGSGVKLLVMARHDMDRAVT